MRMHLVGTFVLLLAAGAAFSALAQTTGPQNPPLVLRSLAGRDVFEFYCAPAMAATGKGTVRSPRRSRSRRRT